MSESISDRLVSDNFSGRLETEVTSMFMSSSRLNFFNAAGVETSLFVWAGAFSEKIIRPNAINHTSHCEKNFSEWAGRPTFSVDNICTLLHHWPEFFRQSWAKCQPSTNLTATGRAIIKPSVFDKTVCHKRLKFCFGNFTALKICFLLRQHLS